MKKTKILMPLLGVSAVAATVAPIVTMTSCNDKKEPVVEPKFALDKKVQNVSMPEEGEDFDEAKWDVSLDNKEVSTFDFKALKVTVGEMGGVAIDEPTKAVIEELLSASGVHLSLKPTLAQPGWIKFFVPAQATAMIAAGDWFDFKVTMVYENQPVEKTVIFDMGIKFIEKNLIK